MVVARLCVEREEPVGLHLQRDVHHVVARAHVHHGHAVEAVVALHRTVDGQRVVNRAQRDLEVLHGPVGDAVHHPEIR